MLRLGILAFSLSLLVSLPAAAQGMGAGGVAGKGFSPIEGVGPKATQREAPPPGLPGSQARITAPAPEVPLDVPPTEALFDAINRGDTAMARDALNRGADISGRNVLGMTPLDLSVDLSRNDITFLLLSMRTQASVSLPPSGPLPPPSSGKTGSKRTAEAKATRRDAITRVSASQASAASAKHPAVRYAGVPSAPVPTAGFLGFGSSVTP